jgi:hypothetical protein
MKVMTWGVISAILCAPGIAGPVQALEYVKDEAG